MTSPTSFTPVSFLMFVTLFMMAISTAQSATQPPAKEAPERIGPPERAKVMARKTTSGARYLQSRYGISAQEAQERVDLERHVAALSAKMRQAADSTYSGITIDHEPVYRITVSFTEQKDANTFRESIDPTLRRYINIRFVKLNRDQISAGMDELLTALASADPTRFVIAFDERNSKFLVKFDDDAIGSKIRSLLPAHLQSDTIIRKEPIPKTQAAPFGLQTGDSIYGGYTSYDYQNPDYKGCTFSWPVRWGTKTGILTAGHCGKDNPTRNYFDGSNGHWVQLPSPTFIRNDPNTKYDYQFHETTGYTTNGWIYGENLTGRPEFSSYEWFNLHALLGYYDQTVGMVMCKSGRTTGITCGEITNGWYTWNGAEGFIEYGKGDAWSKNLSDPGDSGGATFMSPDLMNNVYGYGIHVAGSDGQGCELYGTCTAVSMPIDYVDDHYPLAVMLNAYIPYQP